MRPKVTAMSSSQILVNAYFSADTSYPNMQQPTFAIGEGNIECELCHPGDLMDFLYLSADDGSSGNESWCLSV